ncbi:NAD(P)H-hydrate dehydratase [Ruegeria lacuscaerulensis]|uniref:NAD(P)H-hydrate dehydratase n=1 Tax=Ruegeria lacuscaerulensis TaxID=55218 RepID=UPI0014807793|nr:NAD(P)H-hydrate dehydratase [Ruegeria lacuscaerulensis]
MTELLTAAQMRAIEQAAIESGEFTGLELMERAGQGVVEAIFEEWPELNRRGASPSRSPGYLRPDEEDPLRAVVLCGPGNNGGDGFVVARLLHGLGWAVDVFLYGDAEKLPPDARENYGRWVELGAVQHLSKQGALQNAAKPDIVVDSVFGTGLARPIEGELGQVLQSLDAWIALGGVKVIAVDTPSGLCSDSGKSLGPFAVASLTVAFHLAKRGHFLDRGAIQSGRLIVKSIGLAEHWNSQAERPVLKMIEGAPKRVFKGRADHKYTHGHAFILTGGAAKTGAARLAARGALRIGAGLVTLGVPGSAQMEVAAQVTALMVRRIDGAEGFADALGDERLNALCLGPGMGLERARELVPVVLQAKRATVLDADALTAFADDPAALLGQLHENCVLTPHGGEFARLFPDITEKLAATPTKGPAYSKVDATREAAKRAGCVVLFKGPDTVIAAPDGRCSINAAFYDRSAPWLATAGSGDVLAGFITGLLARGFAPMQAAETGAWLHVECARSFGPGLIAEDLPEQLPYVLKNIDI